MNRAVIFIHGKGGSADEAEHYRPLFPDSDVIGFDYKANLPWEARGEFRAYFEDIKQKYSSVTVVAGSLGAYFSLISLGGSGIERAFFISPVADMERLICDMMTWAGVTEAELREKGVIEVSFGDPLSWEYLSWVRDNPVKWDIPTYVLYGSADNLQSIKTIEAFCDRTHAKLTVMENAEHWFHTEEQLAFLDNWIINNR